MTVLLAFAFAPLLVQLALISVLGGAVNRAAYRLFGKTIYLLLMWPGVAIHELSHLAGCLLTGTRVRKVAFFSPRNEAGGMTLGFVEHDRPRNVMALTVIAGAPFFGGAAAILGLTRFFLPAAARIALAPISLARPELPALAAALSRAFEGYASVALLVASSLDWSSWRTWLSLYFLFSLAAHVAPSRTDLAYAASGAVFLGAALLLFESAAARYSPAAAFAVASWSSAAAGSLTVLLGYGLAALLAASAVLALASALLSFVRGQK